MPSSTPGFLKPLNCDMEEIATINKAAQQREVKSNWQLQMQKAVFEDIAACFPQNIRQKMVAVYDSHLQTK